MNVAKKIWERGRDLLPVEGFLFDRPLVLFQSDDWGRVGVRDHDGWDELRSKGIALGEHPYDFYTLETAEDLAAFASVLKRHQDGRGFPPCVTMNFVLFNLDLAKMRQEEFQSVHLLPLADGLPEGWERPGLLEAYKQGIRAGVFSPALHGTTHFCRSAVEVCMRSEDDRRILLRRLWWAGTPYIYSRMPWVGYEYWDPSKAEDDRFLSFAQQRDLIGSAVGAFAKMFSALPLSACAPGYRGNDDTHRAWAQHGIHVGQNGSGTWRPPYFDRNGILHLSRNVEFEPATDTDFSVERCVREAEECFARGLPAIVSLHSINFHSTVRDFCNRTLDVLDQFLRKLESRHPRMLYLRDGELLELIRQGQVRGVSVNVTRKNFTKGRSARKVQA